MEYITEYTTNSKLIPNLKDPCTKRSSTMSANEPNERRREKMWETGGYLEEMRANMRERKTERLQLRVTPTEKEEVDSVTEMLGVSAADYLMHLHGKAMKELDRKMTLDVRRRGNEGDSPPRKLRPPRRDDDEPRGASVRRKPRRPSGRSAKADQHT